MKKARHSACHLEKKNGEDILTVFPFHISLWLIHFESA